MRDINKSTSPQVYFSPYTFLINYKWSMVFNIQIVFSTNYSLISNGVLNLSGFVTFPDYYIMVKMCT